MYSATECHKSFLSCASRALSLYKIIQYLTVCTCRQLLTSFATLWFDSTSWPTSPTGVCCLISSTLVLGIHIQLLPITQSYRTYSKTPFIQTCWQTCFLFRQVKVQINEGAFLFSIRSSYGIDHRYKTLEDRWNKSNILINEGQKGKF